MPFVAINPATEEVIDEFGAHGDAEVNDALALATRAYGAWRASAVAERAACLTRVAELLESEVPVAAAMMTREMGKTFAAAKGEVLKCAMTLRYFAERGPSMLDDEVVVTSGSRSGVRFDPVGIVFAIMPWNFPLWQVIRMAAPTLVAGNVVVYKHAPNVPGSATYLEDLFVRAGVERGVVTNLFVETDRVEAIIADPRVAAVTLTGSERAGRAVAQLAGRHLKKCVLELGGSDPFIVASSANMETTVDMAVTARIQNNGQACIAAKRYLVVRERADEFVEMFADAMAAVRWGDPMDPATALGPLVSKVQRDLLVAQVASSVAAGARVLAGGVVPDGPGFFYPATVLSDVPRESRAGREELFGPAAVVVVADDLDDALRRANDTPWGLGASIWAADDGEIDHAIAALDVGTVFANAIVSSMPELPFGGTKNSGFGRELSKWGAREFTNTKSYFVA